MLQEFIITVTRKIALPLNQEMVRQIVADLGQWHVHSPEVSDLLQTIDFQARYQLSLWDAMVIQSAAHSGCKRLLSEDLSHGQVYGEVEVINPFKGTI